VPQVTAQTIINTYNDLPFTRLDKWIAGIFYFSYLVAKVSKRNDPTEDVVIRDEEWETLFCTTVDKLRNYALKIADYYEKKNVKRTEPVKIDLSVDKADEKENLIQEETLKIFKKEVIEVEAEGEEMAIERSSIEGSYIEGSCIE
jgi:hypothetical protein